MPVQNFLCACYIDLAQNVGAFNGPGSFRPRVVSTLGHFGPGRFGLGRFGPGSFRPNLVCRFGLIFFLSFLGKV